MNFCPFANYSALAIKDIKKSSPPKERRRDAWRIFWTSFRLSRNHERSITLAEYIQYANNWGSNTLSLVKMQNIRDSTLSSPPLSIYPIHIWVLIILRDQEICLSAIYSCFQIGSSRREDYCSLPPPCLSYVFTIAANYISGRHNEDWYSVQTSCATLNNIMTLVLKCVHRRGRDP